MGDLILVEVVVNSIAFSLVFLPVSNTALFFGKQVDILSFKFKAHTLQNGLSLLFIYAKCLYIGV